MKIRCCIILILLLSGLLYSENKNENLLYNVSMGSEIAHYIYNFSDHNTYYEIEKIYTSNDEEVSIEYYKLLRDYSTIEWRIFSETDNKDVVVIRKDNSIRIKGYYKGVDVTNDYEIANYPWYQDLGFCLRGQASSKSKNVFYTVGGSPSDFKPRKMYIKKRMPEKIKINEQEEDAMHLVVSLTGFASIFWHADLWYRLEDNQYLKLSTKYGIINPKTIIELTDETYF